MGSGTTTQFATPPEELKPAFTGEAGAFLALQDPWSGLPVADPFFTGYAPEPVAGITKTSRQAQQLLPNFLQTNPVLRSAIQAGSPITAAAEQAYRSGFGTPHEFEAGKFLTRDFGGTPGDFTFAPPISPSAFAGSFSQGESKLGGDAGSQFNLANLDAARLADIQGKTDAGIKQAAFKTGPGQIGRIQNLDSPFFIGQGPGQELGLDKVRIQPPTPTIKDAAGFDVPGPVPAPFTVDRNTAIALGALNPATGLGKADISFVSGDAPTTGVQSPIADPTDPTGGTGLIPPLIPSSPPPAGTSPPPPVGGPTVAGPAGDGGTVAGPAGDDGRGFLGTVDDLIPPGGGPIVDGPTVAEGPLGANNGTTEGPNGETILDPDSGVVSPYLTGPNGEPILSAEAAYTHGIQREQYDSGDRAGIDNFANYPQNEFYTVPTLQQELIQAARHITNKPLFPPPPPPQTFTPVNEIPLDFNFTDPNAAHTFSLLPPENIQFYSDVRQSVFNENNLHTQELINASRVTSGLPPLIDETPDPTTPAAVEPSPVPLPDSPPAPPVMQETPFTFTSSLAEASFRNLQPVNIQQIANFTLDQFNSFDPGQQELVNASRASLGFPLY